MGMPMWYIGMGMLPGFGIIGRTRPVFRPHDLLAVGRLTESTPRTATLNDEEPRR